jgi:hypothetical protein
MFLIVVYLFPGGIVDIDKLQSKDILVAFREGVANCRITVRLKENKKFIIEEVCFGIDKVSGSYNRINDSTIKLNYKCHNCHFSQYDYIIISVKDIENKKVAWLRMLNTKSGKYLQGFNIHKIDDRFELPPIH